MGLFHDHGTRAATLWRLLFILLIVGLFGLPLVGGTVLLLLKGSTIAYVEQLVAQPSIGRSIFLSVWIAGASTIGTLIVTVLLLTYGHGQRWFSSLQRLLSPLLALPHVAFAIGFSFLLAPSGWIVRLLSPTLTGFTLPPDWHTIKDPWGIVLIVMLILKETPFLLLMALAYLDPHRQKSMLIVGKSMGFSSAQIWWRLLLPTLWPALRLPLYAIAAYGMSVIDLAILLGPDKPATLAVRIWLWYQDYHLIWHDMTSSGAIILLLINLLLIAGLRALEWCYCIIGKHRWLNGARVASFSSPQRRDNPIAVTLMKGVAKLLIAINIAVFLTLVVWSFARRWSFPDLLPTQWSTYYWQTLLPELLPLLIDSMLLALICAFIALLIVILALEAQEDRKPWPLWLICLPLLLPQASLLFGIQLILDQFDQRWKWGWVLWGQLLFVIPYTYLCLQGAYRQFDHRFSKAALTLGASPWRIWWRIKAPLLAQPLLFAFAVGAAVSLAQYLPTLLFGAGRIVTITTEAVALGSGLNRRLSGITALLQLLLPLVIYITAIGLAERINPARDKSTSL